MLSAALNVNGMLWRTSPSATELESHALDWLRQLRRAVGRMVRHRHRHGEHQTYARARGGARGAAELAVRERGLAGRADLPTLRIYTSAHSHSSVDKARSARHRHENVVHVPVTTSFRIAPTCLAELVVARRRGG